MDDQENAICEETTYCLYDGAILTSLYCDRVRIEIAIRFLSFDDELAG